MGRWGAGGGEGNMTFFWGGVKHVYCAKFMLTVSHNGNPIIFNIYIEVKYPKNLNNILNQNVNVTKRARLSALAIISVDNLCLLQQYRWPENNQNAIAAINHQSDIRTKFHDHF